MIRKRNFRESKVDDTENLKNSALVERMQKMRLEAEDHLGNWWPATIVAKRKDTQGYDLKVQDGTGFTKVWHNVGTLFFADFGFFSRILCGFFKNTHSMIDFFFKKKRSKSRPPFK